MLRRCLLIFIAISFAAPRGAVALQQAASLAPLSRSLVEGPSRAACFLGESRNLILGAGAGIVVLRAVDSLERLSFLPLDGKPYDIAVKGSYAYVAAFESGLEVIDASDAGKPREIFSFRAPRVICCAVSDGGAGSKGALFLADADSRLYAFDLARPDAPLARGEMTLPAPVIGLAAEKDLLCVLSSRAFTVFRVLEDASLKSLAEVSIPGGAGASGAKKEALPEAGAFDVRKGSLGGAVLCVLSSQGEARLWDLSTPEKPISLGALNLKNVAEVSLDSAGGMCVTAKMEVIPFTVARSAESNGSGAAQRLIVGKAIKGVGARRLASAADSGAGAPRRGALSAFRVGRDRFALVEPFGGASLFDYDGRRGEARALGRFETGGFALNLVASHGLLYVANNFDGVRIGRVGGDGAVDWIGHLALEEARDVALDGTSLFIANGASGLVAADVSDPRRPRIVGRYPSPYSLSAIPDLLRGSQSSYYLCALTVRGGKAYCAAGLGGVEIFDVSDRKHPRLFWRERFSEVRGIDTDGRFLYFADGYKGFRIFSLLAGKPSPVSALGTGAWNSDCMVAGDIAYLGNGGSGVMTVDVSDRGHPRTLGSIRLGSIVREVFVLGKTLFVANERGGVAALDVSDPRNLSVAAKAPTADDARGIFADGTLVYSANGEGGVYVFKYER